MTACALIHVAAIAYGVSLLPKLVDKLNPERTTRKIAIVLSFGLLVIVAAHTIQIWSWAACLSILNAFEDFSTSFYFATVTYTTLGYGDLILGERLRIFATFASITGLLTFGISTAFLIALITRMFPSIATR
ncbi:MAG: ion channel [Pseudomonadota bacterium]